jgi:hypothetical protein
MSKVENPLENIKIASPCSADWEEMFGDERKRFCGECRLNVYNLSGMSRDEAENFLMTSEGRVCVRYYLRADGTVLTDDCPVGWAGVKKQLSTAATAIFSLVITLFSGVLFVSLFSKEDGKGRQLPIPFAKPTPVPIMGAIAVAPKENKPKIEPDTKSGPSDALKQKVLKQAGV